MTTHDTPRPTTDQQHYEYAISVHGAEPSPEDWLHPDELPLVVLAPGERLVTRLVTAWWPVDR